LTSKLPSIIVSLSSYSIWNNSSMELKLQYNNDSCMVFHMVYP
jgi:hypothetical protein